MSKLHAYFRLIFQKRKWMLSHQIRNLQLVSLSHGLQQLADRLQPDVNAARFLVHETLMQAFGKPVYASEPIARRDLRRSMIARHRGRSAATMAAADSAQGPGA